MDAKELTYYWLNGRFIKTPLHYVEFLLLSFYGLAPTVGILQVSNRTGL
jgi:hypothetical protein